MSGPWIEPDVFARLHGDGALQVVDCRFRLGEHGAGRTLYAEGHIPGALYLDLDDDLSGPVREDRLGGRHPLPSREAFLAACRRAGLRRDVPIVVYDDGSGGAARAWWLLRHHGVPSRVLRGGLAAWEAGLAVGGEDHPVGDLDFAAERTDDLVDARSVEAAIDAGEVVMDARAPARFRGEVEPVDPVAGHIVGAINVPFDRAAPLPPEVLDAREGPIAYCGSGVTACALILELCDAGREDGRLYAGSWSDWCARGLAVNLGPMRSPE
jgi:thiosulfate/3-mercaptopyruvate sulfurtransferase